MADWSLNGDWASNGDWEGVLAGDALLKIQSEVLNLSDADLKTLGTALLKQISESSQLSESDLTIVELAPTGHTGWGIPIGIQ